MCMLFLAAKDGFSYCREMSYMLQKCFILLFKVIIKVYCALTGAALALNLNMLFSFSSTKQAF